MGEKHVGLILCMYVAPDGEKANEWARRLGKLWLDWKLEVDDPVNDAGLYLTAMEVPKSSAQVLHSRFVGGVMPEMVRIGADIIAIGESAQADVRRAVEEAKQGD